VEKNRTNYLPETALFILFMFFLSLASQEFHLKTQERAMQHTSASSSSSLHCNDSNKVNLAPTILNSNINVSSHNCII